MKILSRDFSRGEKALILLLILVLLALAYYQFVFVPIQNSVATAEAEKASLETELTVVNMKVADLERMRSELDSYAANGSVAKMPSYNNSKAETDFLNDILVNTPRYSVSFSNVTRNGDQIRRNFSLDFTVADYNTMKQVIANLADCEYRCLIDDVRVSVSESGVTAGMTATFYETMVGGVADSGLPADSSSASAVTG